MIHDDEGSVEYGFIQSFFIDTDGYTDRDREMFVCGWEFCEIYYAAKSGNLTSRTINSENSSRVRIMLSKKGIIHSIEPTEYAEWSELKIQEPPR